MILFQPDARFYDKKIYSYPAKDLLFFQADIHGNLLIRQRMKVIRALLEEKRPLPGALQYTLTFAFFSFKIQIKPAVHLL